MRIPSRTVSRLKKRAKGRGQSLSGLEARALADRVRLQLAGRRHSDSVELLAKDRAR